ncbi:hypothetical protein HRW23_04480 [Streptomyces lunaelactis]|uniref:hypothetical protein n=2 Tax=Streptomyces lunaelactis TaxID=1535768 RepID=UPI00158468FC|nr:hypothetical protein [Streptomyces lunaelactis]NUK70555.1 hypothetical protein [Streptomyces lunaelactis]NUK76674.1 hypothetical protein [Streptomyces lunaelactis]
MPDRRRRTDLLLPRERQSTDDNNPFAPPPEGRPDQPWQPRRPTNDDGSPDDSSSGSSGPGSGSSDSPDEGRRSGHSGWGSQWSSRQPGRSSGGGFGGRPGGQNGQDSQDSQNGGGRKGPEGGGPGGLKWDPTDPAQRRARYALLSGMWAFFFALFDFPEIALLLGALALYWSISSLRAKPQSRRTSAADVSSATPPAPPAPPGKPQITAAVSGLVMASIALVIVAASFTAQLVYREYYTCVNDSLTKSGQLACNDLLPEPLRGVLGVKE